MPFEKTPSIGWAEANARYNEAEGYIQTPYAWEAPETFITQGTTYIPFNPNEVGIGAHARNVAESDAEIDKQQGSIKASYWNAFVTGVLSGLPGIGPTLAAQKMAGGTPSYPFKMEDRDLVSRFNPEDTGIAPLANNVSSAANEVDKQGGYDWSLLLPANWLQTIIEYLAAEEAAKEGGSLPVRVSEDIKGAGANVIDNAKDAGEGGKKIIDFLGGDPAPDTPFDIINFLKKNPMIVLGVGGLLLLVMIVK